MCRVLLWIVPFDSSAVLFVVQYCVDSNVFGGIGRQLAIQNHVGMGASMFLVTSLPQGNTRRSKPERHQSNQHEQT
jgi:hypothetical protein